MDLWKKFVTVVFCAGIVFSAIGEVNIAGSPVNIAGSHVYIRSTSSAYGNSVDITGHVIYLRAQRVYLLGGGEFFSSAEPGNIDYHGRLTMRSSGVLNLSAAGNVHVGGTITSPIPKAFIHPHPTDTSKVVRYVAIESGEALTLARGTAKTVGGEAVIKLPEHFSMVTSGKEPLTVILTPKGAPVVLYTKQESRSQIVVAMKKSDFSEFNDIDFSYQVTGVRDGFENSRVVINEIELDEPIMERDPKTNEVQRRIDAMNKRMEARAEARREKKQEVEDEN